MTTSGVIQPNHPSLNCPRSVETAAYLDGELSPETATLFELHTRECAACAAALNEQKRLLCLLEVAFFGETLETKFNLPKNFARIVTARAQTDMGSLSQREMRRAFLWYALLAIASFCLLGAIMFGATLSPITGTARLLMSALGMVGRAVSDAGAGAVIVLRAITGHVIASNFLSHKIFTWLLLVTAVLFLYKLIGNYHRAPRVSTNK